MSPFQNFMILYSTLNLLGCYGMCKLVEYDNKKIALKSQSSSPSISE